jgi:hypothetical protein
MAENEDDREGDKDWPEVAQVMVSGSPEAAAHGGGGAGAAGAELRGRPVQCGSPEEEERAGRGSERR